jgi:hypothetical protein
VRGFLPVFAVAPAVALGLGSLPLSRRFSVRRARGDRGAIDRGRPSCRNGGPRRYADTEILDAWLSASSGDVDGALARLRDVNTPDARSNLFMMLSLHHGRQRALEWFDATSYFPAQK